MKNFIANGGLPERDGICFDWMTNYTINIHICQVLWENILIFMRRLHKYRFVEMLWNGKNASDLLAKTMSVDVILNFCDAVIYPVGVSNIGAQHDKARMRRATH